MNKKQINLVKATYEPAEKCWICGQKILPSEIIVFDVNRSAHAKCHEQREEERGNVYNPEA